MRKRLAVIGVVALACIAMGAAAQQMSFSGIASVIDGDTLEIHNRRIRLHGIDAPEQGKYCGLTNVYQRASLALSDLTTGRMVSCEQSDVDDHGRAVAICRIGDLDVAQYMVSLGWARDWPRYSRGVYAPAEQSARAERLGVWGMECDADLWSGRNYDPISARTAAPSAPPATTLRVGEIAFVSASTLNVRAGPDISAQVLGRLERGTRLDVLVRAAGWARIRFNDGEAWVSDAYISSSPPLQRAVSETGGDIRRLIVQESISHYSGSCPCPYNVDRGGRRCGGRSAYSRPGGASPLCYASDVTDAHIASFQSRSRR